MHLKQKKKKDNKQCLLDTPAVIVNIENYYQEYKCHTKWLSLISSHFAKINFFGMTLLHAHAHYVCIVYAKYQKASVKALVQVDFLMYALSKHKHNRPGAVARSEASSLGMQAAPSSIQTSGTFFRGDLVMKTFLRPFSLFR